MKAIIVDDEPLSRRRLQQLLANEPDVEVIAECDSGIAAIDSIQRLAPDLVFLDIQMPQMTGFEMLNRLQVVELPLIIFVTAYDQFAVSAFDILALDYVLKPIDPDRLALACERARMQLANAKARTDHASRLNDLLSELKEIQPTDDKQKPFINRLLIRSDDRVVMIKMSDIIWIEAAGNYVRVHTRNGSHLARETLSNLESSLDVTVFARIHRSTVINLDAVKEMRPWFSGEMLIVMDDGTELKLSRTYRQQFERLNRILS